MALDPREGLFEFRAFKGLRNNVDIRDFDPGDLEVGLNVDVDDGENVGRRKGFSAVVVAGVDRSLYSFGAICLGVGSNALKQILPDFSTVTVKTGLTPDRALAYAPVADRVYWSNGVESGAVENGTNRSWGLAVPTLGAVTPTGGALRAGRYQSSMTYIRNDGQESGAALAAVVVLAATGGFTVALPVSADPTVVSKAIYVSTRDGETLYRYAVVSNGEQSFSIREQRTSTVALATQFLSPPPAGDFLGYFMGSTLVAAGNRLYASEPYAPELFDLRKSIPFLSRITMVAPADAGLWLGTDDQVLWLDGRDVSTWNFFERADYGVIPGTLAYGDGELLGDGALRGKQIPFFSSTRGLCIGGVSGELTNLTLERFAYPIQPTGAGVVRRHRGMAQYIATLNGPETAGNEFA